MSERGVHDFYDTHIGKPLDMLPESKLPTKQNILRRIRSLQQQNSLEESGNVGRKQIVKTVGSEVINIWERADTDYIRRDKIAEKLHKLLGELDKLVKHWDRLKPDRDPLLCFKADFGKLFVQ